MTFLRRGALAAFAFSLLASAAFAQSAVGQWTTIDDETGEPKSIIEVYEQDGRFFGKIVKLLPEGRNSICDTCEGTYKGKELIGAVILKDLEQKGDTWAGGQITDPKNGKTYKAKMSLDGTDKLNVRGYIGMPMLGRTQVWHRVKN